MKFNLPFGLGRFWFVRDQGQAFHAKALFYTNLKMRHFLNGVLLEERDLGSGVVTMAAVKAMANEYNTSISTLKLTNWHDTGTGATAPGTSDTTLQIPTGNARIAGTQSNTPWGGAVATNTYQSLATLAYTGTANITEWGIFTAVTAGTLFDRRTFIAIPVINGSTVQFQYQLTIVPGG